MSLAACFAVWLPKCLHWPFCPGVFIAILAFLAAAVTFRDPGRTEKAAWTLVFLALMSGEVWMMGIDRQANENQQEEARKAQLKGFSDIGDGIKASIAESDRNFAATIGGMNQVLQNLTGGDSFGFVVPQPGNEQIPLLVWNHGDHPLSGVTITIAHTQEPDWGSSFFKPIFIGTIGPHDHAPVPVFLVPTPEEKSGQDSYWIMISAQNGTVSESLFLRKSKRGSGWAHSYLVTRPTFIRKQIEGVPTKVTLMKPLLRRQWSDEVEAEH